MSYLNQINLIGRVGRDPETKTWDGGELVKFSVATTKKWSKDGEKKEMTTWHDVTVFGKLGEVVKKYVSKGSSVYVSGELRVDTWDDESGNKRSKWYVVASEVQFLDSKRAETSPEAPAPQASEPSAPKNQLKDQIGKPKVKNYAPGADNAQADDEAW